MFILVPGFGLGWEMFLEELPGEGEEGRRANSGPDGLVWSRGFSSLVGKALAAHFTFLSPVVSSIRWKQ